MITSHGLAQEMYEDRPRGPFSAVLPLDVVDEAETILAYERNGNALETHVGAPLRLRVESQHGDKVVEWIRSVEWIEDHADDGDGRGGAREDSALQAVAGIGAIAIELIDDGRALLTVKHREDIDVDRHEVETALRRAGSFTLA